MLMNNHGRCLKPDIKHPQTVTQAICESKNLNLIWGKRKNYAAPRRAKIPTIVCNQNEFCISSNNAISDVYIGRGNGREEQNWGIVGGGNQLAQGNNCLAIERDSSDIGSKVVMAPCDPQQKGQIWSFITE